MMHALYIFTAHEKAREQSHAAFLQTADKAQRKEFFAEKIHEVSVTRFGEISPLRPKFSMTLANFKWSIKYLAKFRTLFGKLLVLGIGQIFNVVNGQILKK